MMRVVLFLFLSLRCISLKLIPESDEFVTEEEMLQSIRRLSEDGSDYAKYVVDMYSEQIKGDGPNIRKFISQEDAFDNKVDEVRAWAQKENENIPQEVPALSGKHVVFIGDSVTRYQYLNLAHYVAHEASPNDFLMLHGNVTRKQAFDYGNNWKKFYKETNKVLNTAEGAAEICDCHRTAVDYQTCYENRYFTESRKNISLTYLQWFSDNIALKGHWSPSMGYPIDPACKAGECGERAKWHESGSVSGVVRLLEDYVMQLKPKPTHVLLYRDAWGIVKQPRLAQLFEAGQKLNEKYGTTFIWKTALHEQFQYKTPGHIKNEREHIKKYPGWVLFDAFNVTEKFPMKQWAYHDRYHVTHDLDSYVNHEFLKFMAKL